MDKIFIYTLSDEEGKVRWVGQTKNVAYRFVKHLYEAKANRGNKEKNEWINSLISKNLLPKVETIKEITEEGIDQWEQYFISHYRNIGCDLFNKSTGGKCGSLGAVKPFLSQRNKEKCSQSVLQFTTEGVFVNKFESAKEARRQTQINNIQFCATQPEKYRAVGGFIWIWEKEFSQELLNERIDSWNSRTWGVEKRLGANNGAARIIEQLDAKTGELIQEFGCITDAKKKIGNGKGDIGAACRGEQKTACGFKWRYKE